MPIVNDKYVPERTTFVVSNLLARVDIQRCKGITPWVIASLVDQGSVVEESERVDKNILGESFHYSDRISVERHCY